MRISSILLLVASLTIFSGCGEDGEPGDAYLAVDWASGTDAMGVEAISSSTIYRNREYLVGAGTTQFAYSGHSGYSEWSYYGTITITVREGEEGGLFADGEDGADSYFRLYLGSSGPSFNRYGKGMPADAVDELPNAPFDARPGLEDGPERRIIQTISGHTVEIEYGGSSS